jgi:hypothetical protein
MRKEIMSDGNSFKIRVTKKELELYGLKPKDVIDIEISKIEKRKK